MIVNGECGQFNPSLLSCFLEEIDGLLRELKQPEMRIVRPPALNDARGKPAASGKHFREDSAAFGTGAAKIPRAVRFIRRYYL